DATTAVEAATAGAKESAAAVRSSAAVSTDDFRRQLAASILSPSPFVRLAEPHLETPAGRSGCLATHLRRRLSPPEDSSALGRFVVAESERYASQMSARMRDCPPCLALHSFQSQPIRTAFQPCRDPQLRTVDMYGRGDVRLLDFLEVFCFQADRICNEVSHVRSPDRQAGHLLCHLPLAEHTRRFVAESGFVTLVIRPSKATTDGLPSLDQNTIFVRSWCRRCRPQQHHQQQQQQTSQTEPQLTPLSEDAKALSFAQFLRLHFSEHRLSTSACRHSMHAEHVQYFYKAGLVACFEYTPVCLRSIVMPTTAIVVPLDITRQLLESQVSRLTTSGYRLLADIQSIYVKHAYAQKDTVSRLNSIHSGCNAELRAFFDVDRLTAGPEAAAVAFSRKAVLFKQWLTALIDRWQGLLQEAL
uniref:Mut7-C domain-containing protein n=1 Tax=Macrostomum lignano TaxID=282301 RepID=A0A1I8GDL6_9PLAT